MDEQQREFKGVWIPKEIWLDERLNLQEKFYLSIYKEIQNEILTDKLMLVNISKSTLLKVKKGLYKKQLLRKITTAKEAKEVVLSNKNKGIKCDWCGCKTNAIQKHHYPIPKSKGGIATVNICPNCHYEYHLIIKDD